MPKIIKAADFKEMPWKNGGGVTQEIFRLPSSGENFQFRVSKATVHQSGPFSKFPHIDRFLMLLNGQGFVLNQKIQFNKPLDSFEFAGEEEYFCELINGSCTDFNVMIDRRWGSAQVKVSRLPKDETWDGHADYLYLHKAEPEFLIFQPDETVTIQAVEEMIVIEIFILKAD